jgi:hypothetical protein
MLRAWSKASPVSKFFGNVPLGNFLEMSPSWVVVFSLEYVSFCRFESFTSAHSRLCVNRCSPRRIIESKD